ncbi:hypothetical protein [Acidianus ambivalens]|uniref:Uncharacterized protein n=1 Tax=Acidianus ambivalens TaxID=2283 RepID=A0A650CT78_ACIAM|nr:hypothetical protein [Acidianus ambivalens]MQL56434.1 hypothetical protein [Acidianus ambivalens]QGR21071.1 hypothetical protein D1866_02820 [Acidianus ambivalens]
MSRALEKKFKEKKWVIADFNLTELKQFLKDLEYEAGDEDLPELESLVFIGIDGRIEYFSGGRLIVIKNSKNEEVLRKRILEWLIKNNVYWDFLL